ncbi:hypothetical protein [Streptomyces sp. ISL-94]|uniref:hypothetical protein n=1 Tax=Streptomyces sp. ISL-94 TaxID=2819190 RepID=UPI001BE7C469|nr:hypothetical protein [Streptomyces sp. ISL-94]MBT2480985.1 hypothetical protein [Streptomyces sp. ISL-94]
MGATLLVGCGGDDDEPSGPAELSAAEVCPGGMLGPDAVRGLEKVTEATVFAPPENGENPGVTWVAGVLARGYAKAGGSLGGQACRATPLDEKNRRKVSVTFEIQSELQRTGENSESGKGHYWEYDLGRNALAISRQAQLFFDCASSKLAGPDKAVPVAASVSVANGSEANELELREANLAIVHSAALAMAKELGCKDNGGLPDKLVVKEKAAPTA